MNGTYSIYQVRYSETTHTEIVWYAQNNSLYIFLRRESHKMLYVFLYGSGTENVVHGPYP